MTLHGLHQCDLLYRLDMDCPSKMYCTCSTWTALVRPIVLACPDLDCFTVQAAGMIWLLILDSEIYCTYISYLKGFLRLFLNQKDANPNFHAQSQFLFYIFIFKFKFFTIFFKQLYDIRCIYFDISIFLVLHFLLVRASFNHIWLILKKKNFFRHPCSFATLQTLELS